MTIFYKYDILIIQKQKLKIKNKTMNDTKQCSHGEATKKQTPIFNADFLFITITAVVIHTYAVVYSFAFLT